MKISKSNIIGAVVFLLLGLLMTIAGYYNRDFVGMIIGGHMLIVGFYYITIPFIQIEDKRRLIVDVSIIMIVVVLDFYGYLQTGSIVLLFIAVLIVGLFALAFMVSMRRGIRCPIRVGKSLV
jgi:hypothetical protein